MSLKKVDKFTFTSAISGIKDSADWKLFDVDLIKKEVRQNIINHHTMGRYLGQMDSSVKKFQYWYEFMYASEKMIANWRGLEKDFPQYKFDVTEIDVWKAYEPCATDEVLLHTNYLSAYDERKVTFEQSNIDIKDYLHSNVKMPFHMIDFQSVTQDMVWAMLDKCMSNINYELTKDEVTYMSQGNYGVQSTRWVEKKLSEIGHTRDSYFRQFEIVLQNGIQPTYKLCSPFNPQLHTMPYSSDESRGSALQVGVHFQVLSKFKKMFVDWFRKKHQYELVVEICILDNQEHILTRKPIEDTFDEYNTFVEYPEEKDWDEKDLGLAFDMDFPREDKS